MILAIDDEAYVTRITKHIYYQIYSNQTHLSGTKPQNF